MTWRLLDTPPAPGAWNMAVDEALLASVRKGAPPVLRFYRWEPACLSLGRNQPARDRYDLDGIRARGLEVVRRPTGGRAVLHDRELTYSVAVREGVLGSPRAAYAQINRALAAGLGRIGVPAELQGRTGHRSPAPSLAPCFREPAEGEITAAGRKLVGSAQFREGKTMLQHGSLLLEGDQALVRELLRDPSAQELGDPPVSLAMLLGVVPAWEPLVAALRAGWEEVLGVVLEPAELAPGELQCVDRLVPRYRSTAWTWRH